MNDGRLDEAFGLVADAAIRRHRRGQDLVGRLLRALVQRCRDHLAGGRLSQALADSDKAARLGGIASQVAAVRGEVAEAMASRRREAGRQAGDLAAARANIDRGRLTLAEGCLPTETDGSDQADHLQRDLAHRRAAAVDAAERTQPARDRGDWIAGVDALLAARSEGLVGVRIDGLTAHVTGLLAERIRAELIEGRTDRAALLLGRLVDLSGSDPQVRELGVVVRQCRQASEWIRTGEPARAEEALRRLASILPEAAWVANAANRCQAAAAQLGGLRAGPLGLLFAAQVDDPGDPVTNATPAPQPSEIHANPPKAPLAATPLPETFLMRIDGVGSYLIARGESVTIGPISSSDRPRVGLLTDPATPTVTLERVEEDYFLRSARPVMVNDRPTTDAMLTGGEKIALSPRCRLEFTRPNAASTSAVLSLSGARLPQADTRGVVLMDRQVVLAPGSLGHIRAEDLVEPIVLHLNDGRLVCRATPVRTTDRKRVDPVGAIPLDTPVRVGPLTIVLTAV